MSATRQRQPRVPLVSVPDTSPPPAAAPPAAAGTPNLDAAVLRVQAAAPQLVRNATGQVQNRQYAYVTLSAVVDVVLPLLVAEDLVWKTFPTTIDGEPALRYRMTHLPSGEVDEDVMPLPCDRTMQGLGSGITYGRRYALTSYLQLTIDEDDDGASANTRPPAPAAPVPVAAATAASSASRPAQPQAAGTQPTVKLANAAQKRLLRFKAKEASLPSSAFAAIVNRAGGGEEKTWTDEAAAKRWLDRALGRLPARLVDDVLEGIATHPPF